MKQFLLLSALFCACLAEESQILKEFSTGYDKFSSNVYKELLKTNSGNFIVCPLSAHIILALVDAGAQGQTAKELTTALHLPENPEKVQQIFKALSPNLQSTDQYNLSSANKVYVNNGFQISDQFKNIAVNVYDAEIQNIDFKKNVAAAQEINRWVEDKTHDKIKNLIDPKSLDEYTRTVLVNAIYFHGKWIRQFKERDTHKVPFHINSKSEVMTDMMMLTAYYEYFENSEVKILKMDYEGGDVSMHIVLPKDVEGLAAVENKLDEMLVPPSYSNEKVIVWLPKFKIENTIKFKPILQALGVESAFEDYADFGGVGARQENIKISEVVQKAFIEVEEAGTTAAAATAVIEVASLAYIRPQVEPKTFQCDRPFLFYLRLNKLGINFFVGRHTAPAS